ncbi:MAG: tRNA (adenosine(37)-N6)-dimethylallyltransferase MiaA [Thalassobaculaceae bacterium]|nr:tRNA (adenosine(37)-N6)-dimethylallyltransferase MiaA [Thalassobaculaceae bacterium]
MSSAAAHLPEKTVLVIAGPTASGKSALAIDLAAALGGVVINADSMQVYRELRILTDRPSAAEEARVPHRLFGVLPASERGSAAWWRDAASAEIDAAAATGRVPILCGGTGLYLNALMRGIADVPPVPSETVAQAIARYAEIGGVAFKTELQEMDPVLGSRLEPGDSQRLQRAWAVARSTGRALSDWQAQPTGGRTDLHFCRVLLFPPRPVSAEAVEVRFRKMIDQGAVDEVRQLAALDLDRSLPAMRAIGVSQLIDYIDKNISLDTAVEAAVIATRQYAKRQRTWFRHQFLSNIRVDAQFSKSCFEEIFSEIRSYVLTPDS